MRYLGEARIRFIGSRELAASYIPTARDILGELWNQDNELGSNDWAKRTVVLPNGVKIKVFGNDFLPIIEIDVTPIEPEPPPEAIYIFRAAWMPEGIILTPVSAEYPDGWGLPTRTAAPTFDTPAGQILNPAYADLTDIELEQVLEAAETIQRSPFGTEGGIQPQCLLNRFYNNKYLDRRPWIAGLPQDVIDSIPVDHARLRENHDAPYTTLEGSFVLHWQNIYDPYSCPDPPESADDGTLYWADGNDDNTLLAQEPGVYVFADTEINNSRVITNTLLYPQFADYLYTNNIFEPEGDQWYCHRPEEMVFIVQGHEGCFQETNRIRADNGGLDPFYRQLRGHGNLARMAVDEAALSTQLVHISDDFRPGYQHIASRATMGVGYSAAGDNLLFQNEYDYGSFESGQNDALFWETSAPHIANIVNSFWNDPDWPGAEHHVAHITGTIGETLYNGTFDPPVFGNISGQIFSKNFSWLPTTSQDFEGTYGVTGFYGNEQRWGRNFFDDETVVRYGRNAFSLEEFVTDVTFLTVLGVAPYDDNGDVGMRMVTAHGENIDASNGYLTIKVYTRPVKLSDVARCDWTLENSYTFNNSNDWLPYPDQVRFSPDGTKFVFTMNQATFSYDQALTYKTQDFTGGRSALPRDRRTLQLCFVEYKINVDTEDYEFFFDYEEEPLVTVNCSTTNYLGTDQTNIYERTLKTRNRCFCDYDEDGELQFVLIDIDEYTYQYWKKDGANDPDTENYGWRHRKLIFPSGKQVYYLHQYFEDSDTYDDPIQIAVRGWPTGDGTGESYLLRIDYLDVVKEHLVYNKVFHNSKFLGEDGTNIFGSADTIGHVEIWADLSFTDLDIGQEREQLLLYDGTTDPQEWVNRQLQVLTEGHKHGNSANRPNGVDYPNHVIMDKSTAIYAMDQTPQSWWSDDRTTGTWGYHRALTPDPFLYWEDSGATPDKYNAMYNLPGGGEAELDYPYGRAPFEDYRTSIAPAMSRQTGGDNTYFLVNPTVWGSFQTGNIAPQMADDFNSACKLVEYRDRLVLRAETIRKPYADGPSTTDWATVLSYYETMPQAQEIVIYTNFDLDEATGIDNVTDIYPFGRV